jgi:uncharacterized protein YecE (DUF72 family)
MQQHFHIGTSGWHYKHWRGPFYPPGLPTRAWLGFYAERLPCVEINNSFYRLPVPATLAGWDQQTPAGFLFAVKAWRQITHRKRLLDCADAVQTFLSHIQILGEKLGPVLFQLPPRFRCNPQRLADFLRLLPRNRRFTFEFRDPSWHNQAVYDLLSAHNAAWCIFELAGFLSPLTCTADFVYIRLHGPDGPYCGNYDAQTLHGWAERLRRWYDQGKESYLFFDNDEAGFAVHNALDLQQLIAASG